MQKLASSPRLKLLAFSLLFVAAALVTGTAATVYVSGDAARRVNVMGIDRALANHVDPNDVAVDRAHRQLDVALALIDSAVAPLGVAAALDSAALRRIIAVMTHSARRDAPVWIDVKGSSLPGDSVNLALFRAWARARRLPNFWGYRTGFAGAHGSLDLPIRSMYPLKRFVLLNEASADSALRIGDVTTAMIRARENIGAARQLVDQPMTIDMLVGRVLLQHGARLMIRAAEQAHDTVAREMGVRLDAVAATTFSARRTDFQRATVFGVEPNDHRLLAVAADRHLHPALRLEALDGVVRGGCLRSAEVLSGPSAARRASLERLLVAVNDIPRATELAPLYRYSLAQLDHPSMAPTIAQRRDGISAFAANFRWIIPTPVRARVLWCQMLL